MHDREKVIKGLEHCVGQHVCNECPYYNPNDMRCEKRLMRDALELMKEQETVVRCKDCKFYDSETGICAKGITHGYAAEWFCADGEGR